MKWSFSFIGPPSPPTMLHSIPSFRSQRRRRRLKTLSSSEAVSYDVPTFMVALCGTVECTYINPFQFEATVSTIRPQTIFLSNELFPLCNKVIH